jgi:hypothetical protein
MSLPPSRVPPDDELRIELSALRTQNPTLGIVKTHGLLLSTHPGWQVSEKRVRRMLKEPAGAVAPPCDDGKLHPSSRVIDKLDVGKWTSKVVVRYFDRVKGKGLVVKEAIEEGEFVWKEDPFVIAPEW